MAKKEERSYVERSGIEEGTLGTGWKTFHLILTILTFGLWGFAWMAHAAQARGRIGLGWLAVGGLVLFVGGCVALAGHQERQRFASLTPAQQAEETERHAQLKAEREKQQAAAAEAEKRRDLCEEQTTAAFVMTQDVVARRLKAPRTAKFPYITDPEVVVRPGSDCSYSVVAYVDAQNGFGAMLRTRYVATIKAFPDGRWQIQDLKIAE